MFGESLGGRARFEELVADAIDTLPDEILEMLDNVEIVVADAPTATQLTVAGEMDAGEMLLGLYEGIPLTERGPLSYGGMVMPDKITIYRRPILAMCGTEAEVVQQVRVTVIHEVGHHFGIDDARLHELGWG